MSKRMFEILDQMNVSDGENGTSHLQVCGNSNVISVDKSGNKGIVRFGVPPDIPVRILNGDDLRLLLVAVDGKEYDKISKQNQ